MNEDTNKQKGTKRQAGRDRHKRETERERESAFEEAITHEIQKDRQPGVNRCDCVVTQTNQR